MNNKNQLFINIKSFTIIKVIMIFVLFYFLYLVKDILAILFVSLVIASAVDPWVDWFQKRRIPRGLGVLFLYFIIFVVVLILLYLIIPPIVTEVTELADNFPAIETFKNYLVEKTSFLVTLFRETSINNAFEYFRNNYTTFGSVQDAAGGVFSTVSGVVGWIASFFLTLVITFYMVVEENAIKKIIWSIAPGKYQVYTMHLINRMQGKIGLWLRGQLILSIIIFVFVYFGLLVLGIKYALVLALIAAITEFVPYLGPIFAAIPAIFLSFTQGGVILALSVGVFYYIIQLVENNIIVPKLMEKVIGLNPIVSISVLMIGLKIAGTVGMIFSIPVATAINVFVEDLFAHKVVGEQKE